MAAGFRSKTLFTGANIYTSICLLYSLRHILFGETSIVGRILFILFFLLSAYYFIITIIRYKLPQCLVVLEVFVFIFLIYGGWLLLHGMDSTWLRRTVPQYYLQIHMQSILPIFSFYYFSKKQLIDERWFRIVAIFFFISAFMLYESNRIYKLMIDSTDETVNNNAYLWLMLFPIMVFFKKKPVILYLGLGIMMFYILSGFKRGAILLGSVCLLIFIWQSLRSSKGKSKVWAFLLWAVLIYIGIAYMENLMTGSELFYRRLEMTMEGNASNRDVIYAEYWSYFLNQENGWVFLFGNGAFATLKMFGLMAHNDWLEFLIDLGLFGTLVYLIYWLVNIKMCVKSSRYCSHDVFLGILLFIVVNLGRSLFSMSIMDMSVYATSVFGYCVAQYDNAINQINKK